MNLLNGKRIFKLGLTNFWRNRWLSVQATLVLAVTLIFVTVFLLGQLVLGVAVQAVKDKIDLTVYFDDSFPETQILNLQVELSNRADVKNVRYISKDEAIAIWQGRPISPSVKGLVTEANNPLPRSLQIKTDDLAALEEIARRFSSDEFKDNVRQISYQETKSIIDRLLKITQLVTRVGLGLSVLFVVISIVVILNTIRLTIFTRREEIEIMRLVGASSSFARLPFLIEAALYGLGAAVVAFGATAAGVWLVHPVINNYLGSIGFDFRQFFISKIDFLLLVEFSLGVGLALVSTAWEMRRHLRF